MLLARSTYLTLKVQHEYASDMNLTVPISGQYFLQVPPNSKIPGRLRMIQHFTATKNHVTKLWGTLTC